MRLTRPAKNNSQTCVAVLTADAEFEQSVRSIFASSPQIELRVVSDKLAAGGDELNIEGVTVVVIDLDIGSPGEMAAMERLMARVGSWPPVVAVTPNFDAAIARTLLQMRVA
ncbi:MAG: hypothetical protein ABUL48_04560, partial [Pseudorhodoplanes sp.]